MDSILVFIILFELEFNKEANMRKIRPDFIINDIDVCIKYLVWVCIINVAKHWISVEKLEDFNKTSCGVISSKIILGTLE